MELRYWALLIFLGSIWGSAFMFIKIATPELGAVFLVQLRLALASLVFLPLYYVINISDSLRRVLNIF